VSGPAAAKPTAIECKWSADEYDPRGLKIFRRHYPRGENLVVTQDVERGFTREYSGVEVRLVGLEGLIEALSVRAGESP